MQSNTSAVTAVPIATASDPLQIRNTETESSSLRSIEVVSPMTAAHSLHSDNNETDADLTQTQGSLSNEEHHEEHAVTECSNVDCSKSECETKSSAIDGQLASKRYLIIANVSKKPNMKTLIYSAAAHGFSVAIVGIPNMSISDLHLAEEVIGSGNADNRSRECWRNNNSNNNNINAQNTANNSNSNNENDNNNSSSSSSVNCKNTSVKEHKDASDTHNIVDIASSVDANRDQLGTADGDDRTIEMDSKEREDRVCSIDNESKDILHTALASNLHADSDSNSKNRNNSSNNNSNYIDDERDRDRGNNSNSNNNTSSHSTDSPSSTLHPHSSSGEPFSSSTASTSISTSISMSISTTISKNVAPKITISPSKPLCNIIRFETLGELKLFLTEQNIKLFGIEIMDEGKHAVIRSNLI